MKMYLNFFKEFPIDWEMNILNLLPNKYKKKYSSLIKSILKEVKDIYIKDMQDFLSKIILSKHKKNENYFPEIIYTNYKFIDDQKIFKNNIFLKHRKLLNKKYYLHLNIIKIIINQAQVKFPIIICNFKKFHHFGFMSLTDFQNTINNDIKKGSLAVTNQFYNEILKAIVKNKVLKKINKEKLPNIIRCITHVFVQQILNLMIRSIDHILNIMSNKYCPQIKFQLIMQDGQLFLSPSIKEIFSVYHNIIEKIKIIAQDLIPFEKWFNIKILHKYIKIKLPDSYIQESHKKLQIILDNLFISINNHIKNIIEKFYPTSTSILKKEILSFISEKIDFDLYIQHIQKYNTYLKKLNAMIENTYHIVGKLEQREAKESLKKEFYDIKNILLNKLIMYHQEFNQTICSDFENLKTKALNIPKNPQFLIELIDYISYASQILMKELENKIQYSIYMLNILSEITILSHNHIQLNKKTINWLYEIKPIFKQSNTLCEAMKNELEDDIQKRINNLNINIENIIPQLDVLNNMDDINKIEEYVEYYKNLLKQINQINYEMQKINKEETLFKFSETEFLNVIELHEIIISFYDLIYIIYQWQRDHSVWLDGPFEYLDTLVIESKTLNYFEKITEMNKTFKIKIKMDTTLNKHFKFSGIADDPDPMQQPAPLKLCWQALNSINDFKHYLPLIICMCNPALQKRHWIEMSAIYILLLPPNYTIFLETLENVCISKSIYVHDIFKLKIIQVFELMHVHQSLMIVGNPFVGKTEILNILQIVLQFLYKQGIEFGINIKIETIIPTTIDINYLFGYFDKKMKIWKNGICSKIFNSFSKNDPYDKRWIIFDGSLNTIWIENLYSILDTNKILYLTSDEKINMQNSISIIFETISMEDISPAILSTCGIIYIESNSIDWRPYVKTYFSKHNIYDKYEEILYELFDWIINPCLEFIQKNCIVTLAISHLHYVISTLNLFEMYLRDALSENTEEKEKITHFLTWAQVALILSVIWGLGGNLDIDSHIKFNNFCISLWSGINKEYPKPEIIKNFEVTLPHEGLIQDNFYIFKGVGNWKYWGNIDILKSEKILESSDCSEIFVPTINTMKYNHIILKHIKYKKPFIICGNVSIGKTYLIKILLKNKLPEGICSNLFNFISLSTAAKTQQLLISKLNKIRKKHYGPPKNQFCVNFIEDLNIQKYEYKSEINNILDLIRQYHNYGYLYDINEPDKIFIHDIMFSLSIISNTTIKICPRFLRYFNLYTMYEPSVDTIFRIFSNVLFNNLKKNYFTADILSTVTSITNATIDMYNFIIKILRPIPTKFQYQFSIRDIAKVINGCSLLQKESIETKVTFMRLWAHEIWRVFGDRILDNNDKEWLFLQIKEISKQYFKDSFETVFDYLPKFDNKITKDSFYYLMFGSFIDTKKDRNKKYEEINSIEKLKNKIIVYLSEYNNINVKKHIDIVISQYVLECLIKISRILIIPGSNLLIISSLGSGRKSLVTLAAYMQQQELFEPSIHSYCNFKMWRKDIKMILQKFANLKQDFTLFLKDKQIGENFLHDICCLLATGEIPNLFSNEEKYNIIEMIRLHAQNKNKNEEISNCAVMNYFLEQCKSKLHIIICFATTNNQIRLYLHKYPELIKYCTLNWYEMWPTDTLMQIGLKYIQDIDIEENIKSNVIKTCIQLHNYAEEVSIIYYKETGTKIHVTLSTFLHMLKLYVHLICKKQKNIITMKNRYLIGLEKIKLAAQQVEKMKTTLTILKPQLESSAQKMIITMKEVENENISIEKATAVVQEEEEIANKKTEIASKLKLECEADLAVAIPILEDAIAALNTLKPTDITLVKSMKNPPDTVKLVMAAICVMLNVPPDRAIDTITGKKYVDYWSPSKRILSDMNFLQILKDYDKDNISSNIIQIIKKTYITDNNFKPHIVAKASSAAEGLCKWVCAMVSYDEVAKAVAPKKEKLLIAQKECNEAEVFLNKKRKTLSTLNVKLGNLNNSLQETLQQKIKLEKEIENCTIKLHKAENLITSLEGEKDRWMQLAENLKTNYDNLVGDMILTCGIISYIASYNIVFRNKIVEQWKQYIEDIKISYSKNYNLINMLGEDSNINYWYFSGLPKNNFSVENAIIMNNSKLWSLFIDSQNQANEWIKRIEKKNDLKIIKLTDSNYLSIIQYNAENGIPTLIENVGEELEISLDPFLLKKIYNIEKFSYLDTGFGIIKYSFDFRLYITTRLLNPQYSYETFSKLTIINFSITNEALQDRLLDFIISKEKPKFQEKFEALLIEDANNIKVLKQQEDIILNILSSTTTNILEDEIAIKSLDTSKNLFLSIMKKQEITKTMSMKINKFRNAYVHFVKYCADLFDILNILPYINHMYRFSFAWFMQLYRESIKDSNKSTILEKRLKYLKSSFTHSFYSSICRSLSEKHKILYSFLLCSKILLNNKQTTEKEIKYFIRPSINHINTVPNFKFDWLPYNTWINIYNLSKTFPSFFNLADDFCYNNKVWEQYYNSESLEDHLIPEPWNSTLSTFQKLILVKILHPDKIIIQIMQMIKNMLGNIQNYSLKMKISQSYAESNYLTPLLFILPACVTPLALISTYAKTKGYLSKFISLSMSKGQEEKAEFLIQKAQKEGNWVFLQNCHLVTHWISYLEKIYESCSTFNVSLNFRLWLSSYCTNKFPINILQNSIKIMHDYPLNIEEALLNIYQCEPIINKEFFEGCPGKDKIFLKLLFGICLFHVIIQEKKYFSIQGWNVPYIFEHTDLKISIMQLKNFINNTNYVPFDILLYFIGECNYGGKIQDEFDSRYLKHLLNDYCNSNIIENGQYMHSNSIQKLIPQRCEYFHIIEHIKKFPSDLLSQIFEYNKSSIITRNTMIAKELVSFLSYINFPISLLDEQIHENEILILINDISDKLYDSIKINEIEEKYTSMPKEYLQIVLLYEIKSLKHILKIIMETLNTLKLTLNGYLPFTNSIKEFAEEIYKNKIPKIWKKIQINIFAENLAQYIDNLLKHSNFIKNWINQGRPTNIWFDALFNCKMFLSAILLTFSKKYNIPIEEIAFYFEITTNKEIEEDVDTYLICGLYICGGRWSLEKNMLVENFSNEIWQNMPPIYLKCSRIKKNIEETYICPIYITAGQHIDSIELSSKNYITSIPLKTNISPIHFIKCGTALFCHIPKYHTL
ncbi:dynein axonemal heavy chain 7-like [Apis cerana]|uniref:dynein axonemal heavy chain 7-like n=1 Tax=Apis cerana TaxID=7461 RepID=UPI002B22238B|nr:dynein axonemal heavy chain 7-like [Apis cerana]